jgi:hypothetical protein
MKIQENVMTLASMLSATDKMAELALSTMGRESDIDMVNTVLAIARQKSAERIQPLVDSGELASKEIDTLIEFFRNSGIQKVNLITEAVLSKENADNIVAGIVEHVTALNTAKPLSPIQA